MQLLRNLAVIFLHGRLLNSELNPEAASPIALYLVCPALYKPALACIWHVGDLSFQSTFCRITLSGKHSHSLPAERALALHSAQLSSLIGSICFQ